MERQLAQAHTPHLTQSDNDSYLSSIKSYIPSLVALLPSSFNTPNAYKLDVIWKKLFHVPNVCLYILLGHQKGFFVYALADSSHSALTLVGSYMEGAIGHISILRDEHDVYVLLSSAEDSPDFPRENVRIYSLTKQSVVHVLRFRHKIRGFLTHSQSSVFCVALPKELHVYNLDFSFLYSLKTWTNPSNVVLGALGTRWLVYAGRDPLRDDIAGIKSVKPLDHDQSLSTKAMHIAANLVSLGDAGRKHLTEFLAPDDSKSSPEEASSISGSAVSGVANGPQGAMGSIVVRDLKTNETIAHFRAHKSQISFIALDPSGTLLVTVPADGQHLDIFHVVPYPRHQKLRKGSQESKPRPRQIYRVFRGMTKAKIRDISFSMDSKWMAVSSMRGTTHIYALNITGGAVSIYSHSHEHMYSGLMDTSVLDREGQRALILKSIYRLRGHGLEMKDRSTKKMMGKLIYPPIVTSFFQMQSCVPPYHFFVAYQNPDGKHILSVYGLEGKAREQSRKKGKKSRKSGPDHMEILKLGIRLNRLSSCSLSDLMNDTMKLEFTPDLMYELAATLRDAIEIDVSEEKKEGDINDDHTSWLSNVEKQTYSNNVGFSDLPVWESPQFEIYTYTEDEKTEHYPPFLRNHNKKTRINAGFASINRDNGEIFDTMGANSLNQAISSSLDAEWEQLDISDENDIDDSHPVKIMDPEYFDYILDDGADSFVEDDQDEDIDGWEEDLLIWPMDVQ